MPIRTSPRPWRLRAIRRTPPPITAKPFAATRATFRQRTIWGALLAAEGKLPGAVEQFRYALRLEPGYVDAQNNLGSVLAWQGKVAEARQHLQRALELATAQGNKPAIDAMRQRLQALTE